MNCFSFVDKLSITTPFTENREFNLSPNELIRYQIKEIYNSVRSEQFEMYSVETGSSFVQHDDV